MVLETFSEQLNTLIQEVEEYQRRSVHDDCSDVMSEVKSVELSTRTRAAIERISGPGSIYSKRSNAILEESIYEQLKVLRLIGVARSLSEDLKAGYLRSLEELVHGELFSDFLEMAAHLASTGYKDAAAVIAGSTLEAHLRQLAKRLDIEVERVTTKGTEPKKADAVNSELAKAGAYSVQDQKNVTAWLGIRNQAAHGHYADYQKEQVQLMIDAVRNFMTRLPA